MAHILKSRLLCSLFLVLCGTQITLSQDYVYAAGDPNFSVNIPVENGYINVANGNLHFEFTLANHKQRGALTLDEKLVYDSRIWKIVAYDNHYWWPINIPSDGRYTGGWRFVAGNETGTLNTYYSYYNDGTCDAASDPNNDWVVTSQYYYSWTDPQGTEHQFDGVWTINDSNGACYTPPNPESSSGSSEDGSGYTMQLTGDDSGPPTISVIDSQGTLVYPQVMDRYGNYFSSDSNGNLVDDLGRTPVIATQNGNVVYYDVLTINGARKRYTVTMENVPVYTSFHESGVAEWNSTISNVVQSIQLPDGNSYSFTYDGGYGEVTSVTLPTGGTIYYYWTNYFDSYQNVNRWLYTRTVAGNTTFFNPSVITQCSSNGTGCQEQVEVIKPSGDVTTYQLTLNNGAWNTNTTMYNPDMSIANTYDFSHPCSNCTGSMYINKSLETTALLGTGLVAQRQYVYANPQSGLATADQEWDYYSYSGSIPTAPPSSPPTKEADYFYGYAAPWLLQSETLCGNGQPAAWTNYTYTGTAITTSGIPQHNAPNGPYLTSVSKGLNPSSSTNCAATTATIPVTTTYSLYDTGMVLSATDADNNPPTTYGYDSSGTFVTSVTRPTTNGIPYFSQSYYDFYSGLITQEIDENNQPTGHTYYMNGPNLGKPNQVTYPDGGLKTYSYPSATEVDTATLENPTTTISSSQSVDAYGRAYQTMQAGISSETTYDPNGRIACITNKHVGAASSTDGSTCYNYDGLDRVTFVTQPDSNIVQYSYSGRTVTMTDEALHQKKYQYDAFHQLTSLWEPDSNGNLTLETDYQHDALGNVLSVNQKGNGSTDVPRTRTYTFDPLSRLIQSYSPEAGWICYGTTPGNAPANGSNCTPVYDGNGNLKNKTDMRGVTTSYSYDYLNRLNAKAYSTNAPAGSLASCYAYDTAINGIGRLGMEWTTTGLCPSPVGYRTMRTFVAYDPMGRVWNEQQCALGICTTGASTPPCPTGSAAGISYCYDYAGNQTFAANGINSPYYLGGNSALTFTDTYDAAARLSTLTSNWNDSTHPPNLFTANSSTGYAPPGEIQNFMLGNGISVSQVYDNRLRPAGETATGP